MVLDILVVTLPLLFSLIIPVAVVCIRHTVKVLRQEMILDFESIFAPTHKSDSLILPSFEFVKYKYFLDDVSDGRQIGARTGRPHRHDTPIWAFAISAIPLFFVSYVFGILTFSSLISQIVTEPMTHFLWFDKLTFVDDPENLLGPMWVLIVSYIAGHIFIIRSLQRAVGNFDLNPITFIGAAVHLLMGVTAAVVILSAGEKFWPLSEFGTAGFAGFLLVLAFLFGYVPDLGLRTMMRRSDLRSFKRDDEEVFGLFAATPLEVLDGIDYQIRHRLEDFNIVAVQNMATANPIMLFVETPYGIYQIIDWVAQAQLCCAVGPRKVVELGKLGIRTIFDLERAALDPQVGNPEMLQKIGAVLFPEPLAKTPGTGTAPPSERCVRAAVDVIVDDLHVHRLRQICNRIEERLGEDAKKLRPRRSSPTAARSRYGFTHVYPRARRAA